MRNVTKVENCRADSVYHSISAHPTARRIINLHGSLLSARDLYTDPHAAPNADPNVGARGDPDRARHPRDVDADPGVPVAALFARGKEGEKERTLNISNLSWPLILGWPAATRHLALIAGQWERVGEEYEVTYQSREELLWGIAVMVDEGTAMELCNGIF